MCTQLKEMFCNHFGRKASYIFSAPGRTELGGNHTDHQHGKVLAAAVNREALAAVAENGIIHAFIPNDMVEHFRTGMENALGEGSCHMMSIRPQGGVLLEEC